jgi:hypothetical protein
MEKETAGIICLTVLGVGALIGIFRTKTQGWGRYSSSLLILTLALIIATSLLILGKLDASVVGNIVFAIIGYAGGLISSNKPE